MCTDNTALSLSTTEGATFKTERKLATNIVHPEHYFQNRDFHQMCLPTRIEVAHTSPTPPISTAPADVLSEFR
ncbi:hypothetical protein QTP88_011920 [Uroleucon formosanum]